MKVYTKAPEPQPDTVVVEMTRTEALELRTWLNTRANRICDAAAILNVKLFDVKLT